jgi:hypothetical protein
MGRPQEVDPIVEPTVLGVCVAQKRECVKAS